MAQKDSTKQTLFKKLLVFTKFRLSFLVVISALTGYLFAGGSDYIEIAFLMVGGSFVTAASNGANQIWEKDIDKLMARTKNRPLALGTMSLRFACSMVILLLIIGSFLLLLINLKCMLLGIAAFVSYVFIYTPMKSKSAWAVFIGAFPGAVPPFLGAIAATDAFGFLPGVLFFVQFTWQFPHFWAIAWASSEDYQKAGFKMLPGPKDRSTAFKAMVYTLFLIPISVLPVFGIAGELKLSLLSALLAVVLGLWFLTKAVKLFKTLEDVDAKKLMISSFIYLPILQLIYVIDKLL